MKKQILILLLLLISVSCNRPNCNCTNTNPVFERHPPASNEYKQAILDQLRYIDGSSLIYRVDKYEELGSKGYLLVDVQSDDLCVMMILDVTKDSKGVGGIVKNKGKGYKGAELSDVAFAPVMNGKDIRFELISVGKIID